MRSNNTKWLWVKRVTTDFKKCWVLKSKETHVTEKKKKPTVVTQLNGYDLFMYFTNVRNRT